MTPTADPTKDPKWRPLSMPMPSRPALAERGELALALWVPRILQGPARGTGGRHRHGPGEHERCGEPEERYLRRPEPAAKPAGYRISSASRRYCPRRLIPATLVSASSANNNTGTGQIQRNEAVTLRLAGVVTQVLPNGNLVVAASQEFMVNSELRELRVTGVIRPQDIASDNTVLHDRMAEARIAYGGKGQLTDLQRARWGQQMLDILAPF